MRAQLARGRSGGERGDARQPGWDLWWRNEAVTPAPSDVERHPRPLPSHRPRQIGRALRDIVAPGGSVEVVGPCQVAPRRESQGELEPRGEMRAGTAATQLVYRM